MGKNQSKPQAGSAAQEDDSPVPVPQTRAPAHLESPAVPKGVSQSRNGDTSAAVSEEQSEEISDAKSADRENAQGGRPDGSDSGEGMLGSRKRCHSFDGGEQTAAVPEQLYVLASLESSTPCAPSRSGEATAVNGQAQAHSNQQLEQQTKNMSFITEIWEKMTREEEEDVTEDTAAETPGVGTEAVDGDGGLDSLDFCMEALNVADTKTHNLHSLADYIKASEPVLEHVVDKDAVVLLGNTGAGKSLLMQAVAGRTPVKRKKAAGEHGSAREVWDVDNPLEGFAVGHKAESETSKIHHYTPNSEPNIVYLDAPG